MTGKYDEQIRDLNRQTIASIEHLLSADGKPAGRHFIGRDLADLMRRWRQRRIGGRRVGRSPEGDG